VKIVGASNVLNDKETLDSYSRDISFVTMCGRPLWLNPKKPRM
jgi:hypothetical protein